MSFDTVIFDLDGTLVDSESVARQAGRMAFAAQGLTLDDALFQRLVGTAQDTGEAILREVFGALDFAALDRAWSAEARRILDQDGIRLKPGAAALVARLAAEGVPLAVATSSHRASAEAKLTASALAVHFSTLVTRDCVTRPKPDPEPYLLAAERLGVDPRRCLAFEDSDPGAASAFAAGMTVVQVPDLAPVTGRFAHHTAPDLTAGARLAGLLRDGADQSRDW